MIHRPLLDLARLVPGQVLYAAFALAVVTGTYVAGALSAAAAMSALGRGDGPGATGWLAVAAATIALRAVAIPWREHVCTVAGLRVRQAVRRRLLAHLAALGPAWSTSARSGAAHATVVDGVDGLDPYFSRYLPQFLVTMLAAPAQAVGVALVHPASGAVVAVCLLVTLTVPRIKDAALLRAGRERWRSYTELSADYLESMQGLPTLRSLGAAGRRRDGLQRRSAELYGSTMAQLRVSLLENGLTTGVTLAGTLGAVALAALTVARGAAGPVTVFLVLMLSVECFRPVRDLATAWHSGYLGITAIDGVREILDAVPAVPDTGRGTLGLGDDPPAVELRAVTLTHPGAEDPALRGVDLRLAPGEVVALVGRSGAGKSTVAALLGRELDPDSGSVTIGGVDLRSVPQSEVRAAVAVVAQRAHLFHGTIADNVRLGAPDADDDEVRAALRAAGAEFVPDLPRGADTPVGEGGEGLSGGQRQRIALARALVRGARVLVLDEPTAHVDADTDRRIGAAVLSRRGAVTTLLVAHRLDGLDEVDRVVVLDAGRVVEQGTAAELRAAGGAFAELLRRSREREVHA